MFLFVIGILAHRCFLAPWIGPSVLEAGLYLWIEARPFYRCLQGPPTGSVIDPVLTLRRFGEGDITIAFLASHPVLAVKMLNLSSMRDLRTLLILEVILAGAVRSALLASPASLNPVLIYLLAHSNCCTKWQNNEVESSTMLEFHVFA